MSNQAKHDPQSPGSSEAKGSKEPYGNAGNAKFEQVEPKAGDKNKHYKRSGEQLADEADADAEVVPVLDSDSVAVDVSEALREARKDKSDTGSADGAKPKIATGQELAIRRLRALVAEAQSKHLALDCDAVKAALKGGSLPLVSELCEDPAGLVGTGALAAALSKYDEKSTITPAEDEEKA